MAENTHLGSEHSQGNEIVNALDRHIEVKTGPAAILGIKKITRDSLREGNELQVFFRNTNS